MTLNEVEDSSKHEEPLKKSEKPEDYLSGTNIRRVFLLTILVGVGSGLHWMFSETCILCFIFLGVEYDSSIRDYILITFIVLPVVLGLWWWHKKLQNLFSVKKWQDSFSKTKTGRVAFLTILVGVGSVLNWVFSKTCVLFHLFPGVKCGSDVHTYILTISIGLPVFLGLWWFRTIDTQEQIRVSQEQINSQNLSAAQEAIFSKKSARMRFGFMQLLDLKKENLFKKSVENLLKSEKEGNIDLSKLDLSGEDLSGFYLARANLKKAQFNNQTNLKKTDLTEANLEKLDLRDLDLQGTNLQRANLQRADLRKAQFNNQTDLKEADLTKADLQDTSNLKEAKNIKFAILKQAKLQNIKLGGIGLQVANLEGAILERAILERTALQSANLKKANLKKANLEDANLEGAILEDAILEGAILKNANLEGAKIKRTLRSTNNRILGTTGAYNGTPNWQD